MASEPVSPQGPDAPTLRPDSVPASETLPLSSSNPATDPTLTGVPAKGDAAPKPDAAHVKRLGPYTLMRLLGRGGMGAVWEALDTRLNRHVAVKVMVAGEHASEHDTERFRREAQNSAKLRHPNIVPVHDFGIEAGQQYLVMDLVDGVMLADALRQRQFTYREKAILLEKVARAVHYAHEQGVVHRDLKPSNIMLELAKGGSSSGEVKPGSSVNVASPAAERILGEPLVMDFGLAKDLAQDSSLSQSGQVMGTPAYMPPEQAEGRVKDVGPQSDIYSLGAILYEMLTGRVPFTGENAVQVLRAAATDDPLPPRQITPNVPHDLETICLKCLEKKTERRYVNATALANDLKAWLNGDSISARPPTMVERVAKRWRKNAAVYTVSAVAVIALVALSTAFVWSLNKKRKEAEQARDEAVKAHRDFVAEQEARAKKEAEVKALEQQVFNESKREWNLVFADDFSYVTRIREQRRLEREVHSGEGNEDGAADGEAGVVSSQALRALESNWEFIGGKWDLKDGELRTYGSGNRWIVLKKPVPGDVRIEFECHQESDELGDLSCFMNALPRKNWAFATPGYFFKYGAWGNKEIALLHDGKDLFKTMASPLARGKTFRIRAERVGTRATLTVDGQVIFDVEDREQGTVGPEHTMVGLYTANAETWYKSFRIYTLGPPQKADLLVLAEDHLRRGHYGTALDLFEDVLNSTQDVERLEAASNRRFLAAWTIRCACGPCLDRRKRNRRRRTELACRL